MKILNDEVSLREETRNLKQAQPAFLPQPWKVATEGLKVTQADIEQRTMEVLNEIRNLPEAESFRKEMMQLQNAGRAMTDAKSLLAEAQATAETIGAETEAIEWLLLARRGGGGGGGGSSPGGGARQGGQSNVAALARLGGSREANARPVQRSTRQATGKSGRKLPEEFRYGLDRYFEALEAGVRE